LARIITVTKEGNTPGIYALNVSKPVSWSLTQLGKKINIPYNTLLSNFVFTLSGSSNGWCSFLFPHLPPSLVLPSPFHLTSSRLLALNVDTPLMKQDIPGDNLNFILRQKDVVYEPQTVEAPVVAPVVDINVSDVHFSTFPASFPFSLPCPSEI
jgi:hypothetical protein